MRTTTIARTVFVTAVSACTPPAFLPVQTAGIESGGGSTAAYGTPVVHRTSAFRGHDGTELFEQSWRGSAQPRGVVVIVHGLKDHGGRYDGFARRLVARGYSVYAHDLRGHGRSAGHRATFETYDDLLADLSIYVHLVRERDRAAPIFMLGHSAGGALATLFTLELRPQIAGLVLSAPALRVGRAPFELAATPVVAALGPYLPLLDSPNALFSRSEEVVRGMGEDPLIYQSVMPARTGVSVLDAIGRIHALEPEMNVPLLALHGTADRLTDPRGSAELVHRARTTDKQLVLLRGLYHDLLHEPEREVVMRNIEAWLDEHTAATPLAPAPAPPIETPSPSP